MRTARVALPGLSQVVAVEVADDGTRLLLAGRSAPAAEARFEPACQGLVYGVLLNHRESLAALGSTLEQPPYGTPPKAPVLFIKPWNTHAGHGASVRLPPGA